MRKLAIGDIHGCNKTFKALLDQINLSKDDELTLLGDYIDRGPDSKGVIDTILNLQSMGYQVRALRGNHEQMMLDGINPKSDISEFERWQTAAGGDATLRSFGNTMFDYIPFFESLPLIFVDEAYIFVHAGLNFKLKNPLSDENAFLWIRNFYGDINTKWLKNRLLVHGHTPVPFSDIQKMYKRWIGRSFFSKPVLNLDAGCIFGLGGLVAVDLTNQKLYEQDNIDGRYLPIW
jgi:serine/threonine protein phosphatase 1